MKGGILLFFLISLLQRGTSSDYSGNNETWKDGHVEEYGEKSSTSSHGNEMDYSTFGSVSEHGDYDLREKVEGTSENVLLHHTKSESYEYIVNTVASVYEEIKRARPSYGVEIIPYFSNSIYMDRFNLTSKLAQMQIENMTITGINKFGDFNVTVNENDKKVYVSLMNNETVHVTGTYTLSYLFTKSTGEFNLKLEGGLKYNEEDKYLTYRTHVDLLGGTAYTSYGSADATYQNLGLIGKLFNRVFTYQIANTTVTSISKEIGFKIRPMVAKAVNDYVHGIQYNTTALQEHFRYIITESRRYVQLNSLSSYEFPKTWKFQFESNYEIDVNSFYVTGLDKFYLIGDVSYKYEAPYFNLQFLLRQSQLTGKLQYSYKLSDGSRQKSSFDYVIEKIDLHAELQKNVDNENPFEIKAVNVHVQGVKFNLESYMKEKDTSFDLSLKFEKFIEETVQTTIVDAFRGYVENIVRDGYNYLNRQKRSHIWWSADKQKKFFQKRA